MKSRPLPLPLPLSLSEFSDSLPPYPHEGLRPNWTQPFAHLPAAPLRLPPPCKPRQRLVPAPRCTARGRRSNKGRIGEMRPLHSNI